ncbi:monooxygenase [Allokutzneria sp. A3M-2-11 16]|uniref:styrene monooxygenase/indole monooxygenase family protein n=1 Tax=Allokutzneria sp. A3M-2-11 16 TaxID=2962043 RepID=UPI0020B86B32|nr:styrene monooxygenase/indole monooxygenase family protein [Allokutzneria sp. A3M-2-11 16]MCP3804859.1 monooxygenase [Allokutzneria sp. A3M-2-11 16]
MSIGIVGAGISGLHLALRLHQLGIDATLYTDETAEDIRAGRPRNFVTRFDSTRARERALGVAHWESGESDNAWMHLHVEGGPSFRGKLPNPASSLDFRIYLAALLEDYVRRGGRLVRRSVPDRAGLAELVGEHDLLVVAAGRTALTEVFPRDPERSPYLAPRRHLVGGLYHGIEPPEPAGMSMHMIPGAGEIHAPSYYSFAGRVTAVLVEAVPGGPLDELARWDQAADPGGFGRALLNAIAVHAPSLRERVRELALTRPEDFLQGAVTPVVRHGWAEVADGTFALAIGDAWIVNDPITAQGANLGSRNAFQLAEVLRFSTPPYDEEFCRKVSEQLWSTAGNVVDWTNLFIGEPRPHLGQLISEAADDQRVADAFVRNLDDPEAMWHSISGPEATARFLDRARSAEAGA